MHDEKILIQKKLKEILKNRIYRLKSKKKFNNKNESIHSSYNKVKLKLRNLVKKIKKDAKNQRSTPSTASFLKPSKTTLKLSPENHAEEMLLSKNGTVFFKVNEKASTTKLNTKYRNIKKELQSRIYAMKNRMIKSDEKLKETGEESVRYDAESDEE